MRAMDKQEEAFLKRLLATFRVEAGEHIAKMTTGLIALEKAVDEAEKPEIIETVFREAHSLKGAARAVNLAEIEDVCQAVESVFAALKRLEIGTSSALLDSLHRAADILDRLLGSAETGGQEAERTAAKAIIEELGKTIRSAGPLAARTPRFGAAETTDKTGLPPEAWQPPAADEFCRTAAPKADTVRIAAARMDGIMLMAEELLAAKLSMGQRIAELREIGNLLSSWEKGWTKSGRRMRTTGPEAERKDAGGATFRKDVRAAKLADFIKADKDFFRQCGGKIAAVDKALQQDQRFLGTMTDNLLRSVKSALMLPFSSLLEIFPKLVRDLSHAQGKKAETAVSGGDIEIDRRILEELKDPLIHLIRNCIDHGIEKPEERARLHKPVSGSIDIKVTQKEGGKVEIALKDDGQGIDSEKVKAAAVRAGFLTAERAEKMTPEEALKLVFTSGVSTSPMITDLSGRGLGLAIVREKIENLGGMLSIETEAAKGTTFRAVLPVTLAAFRGVIVKLGEELFVLPTANVERVFRVKREAIKTMENRETIEIDGRAIALVRLADVLGPVSGKQSETEDNLFLVVLTAAEKRIALAVDEIIREQEVLVKGLGRQLVRVKNIAGATVLGTGEAAPLLNVADLIKSAALTPARPLTSVAEKEEKARASILVVEDSITARTLLKNILTAAGYNVKAAVDGLEAFAMLKAEDFAVTISDVDMPRMNGFELTARIRADKKLAQMPVVLVTALDSREDRERGVDVGANAYIVKSSFDQSNLLEVIRRLI